MTPATESDAVIANPLKASRLIDNAGLEKARAWQKQHEGGLLSDAILRLNLVPEADFLKVFAELYGTRFVKSDKIKPLRIDEALLHRVGVRACEKLRMCPFRFDEAKGELHVVAAVPLTSGLESEVKKLANARTVAIYVASTAAVAALIKRWHYRDDDAFSELTDNGAGPTSFGVRTESFQSLGAVPGVILNEEFADETSPAKTVMVSLNDMNDSITIATLRRENARYRIAQEFHRRVTLERSLDAMVERILSVMFELLPAEAAAIWLTTGKLTTKSRAKDKRQVDVPRAVIDQTLISPAGVLVNNALIDERFDRSQSVMIRGVQSVMAVPLRARSRTLGVLYVDSVSQSAAFSQEDLPMLDSIGAQAAILLDNAELIARVEKEVENRSQLARFLSPAAVEEVLSGRMNLKLDGAAAEVTVLFADIRGFTTMSAQMPAEEVVRFLNRFFLEMVESVEAHGGTIDKFIGDCVMALWGAPLARPTDARDAMLCALDMVKRCQKIVVDGKPLETGIGINTGSVVLGAIGSKRRLDYTAIGSAVNLAARLCGIAPPNQVLVTADTLMKGGQGVVAEANEATLLKGIEEPIVPYTVKSVASFTPQPIRLTNVATRPAGVPAAPPPSRKR